MAKKETVRRVLLGLVGLRVVLAVIAIPLAPFLYREHFLALVLMRPTKEVLLAAGFLIRRGELQLHHVVACAVPLLVFAVWVFFYLGRSYKKEIDSCDLPGLGSRLLPPGKVQRFAKLLRKRGLKLVFVGRLAAFPSTLVAAAAGSSGMDARRFVAVDAAGAMVSLAEFVLAGWALGSAYKAAGPWLTAVGVAFVVALAVLVGRYLKRL